MNTTYEDARTMRAGDLTDEYHAKHADVLLPAWPGSTGLGWQAVTGVVQGPGWTHVYVNHEAEPRVLRADWDVLVVTP